MIYDDPTSSHPSHEWAAFFQIYNNSLSNRVPAGAAVRRVTVSLGPPEWVAFRQI